MKYFRRVLGLALLVLLIGAAVTAFFIWRNRAKAPGDSDSAVRRDIKCEDFGDKLETGTGYQPVNFPQPFGEVTICGTNSDINTTYYIFDVDKDRLFDYYGGEMKKMGYNVTSAESLSKGDYRITFQYLDKQLGHVLWYGDKKAFEIKHEKVN